MRQDSAATSGEAQEVSDSMTSLTRVQSLSADRAFTRGSLDKFDPTIIRSPRRKKRDKWSFQEILDGTIPPFSRDQVPLNEIPPIQQKQYDAMQPGGQRQTAIAIEDDEEDDPISDPSSPRGSDHVVGWLSSPDRGLNRDSPTIAMRKARNARSPAVPLKQLNFEAKSRAQSASSSVISVSGDRRPPVPPKTPPRLSSFPHSPLSPNGILSSPTEFEAFSWDATQSPIKAATQSPIKAAGPGPASSPIEAWKKQVAAESSSSKIPSSTRESRSRSGDSALHTGMKRGRDAAEKGRPQPKRRKPIEAEAFPLDLPDHQPTSDRQRQRDMAEALLSTQAKAMLGNHAETQEDEEVSQEVFRATNASRPQMVLEGRDADNYCKAFIDRVKTCMFCDKPLPKDPSRHFLHLSSIFATRQRAEGEIPWPERIDYCKRHQAEIRIFPLGLQAGYPATIDFDQVVERVRSDEMNKVLIRLIESPCSSASFKSCTAEIAAAPNPRKWSSSSSYARIIRKIPGYLGEIGRQAIATGMNEWTKQGHKLPPEEKIHPMTRDDWRRYVLIPEIGRMLIHADIYGSITQYDDETLDYAWNVLEQSREYGLMRFGPESDFDTTNPSSRPAKPLQQPIAAVVDLSHED